MTDKHKCWLCQDTGLVRLNYSTGASNPTHPEYEEYRSYKIGDICNKCDAYKKIEPMTLDDIDTEIMRQLEVYASEYDNDHFEILHKFFNWFRTNRTALEAGMRGMLRFKITSISEYSVQVEIIRTNNDMSYFEGLPLYTLFQCNDYEHGVKIAKVIGRKYAESLGLTAEFVEETND